MSDAKKIESAAELDQFLDEPINGLYIIASGYLPVTWDEYFHAQSGSVIEIPKELKPVLLNKLPLLKCRRLGLGWMDIDADDIDAIVSALPDLESLDLGGNHIDAQTAGFLVRQLLHLERLYLSHNSLGDRGAIAISESLPNLTELNLNNNGIGDQGASALAERLVRLSRLNLHKNNIGDGGARAIAKRLTSLSRLYISDNAIGDDGASAIAKSLTNLIVLDISNNNLGNSAAYAFAIYHAAIVNLDISGNKIDVAGGRALLDGLSEANLRWLDLRGNPLCQAILTPEVFESADALAILAAWKAQKSAAEEGRLVALDEAKMLVLGDEAVGKTSLVRFLIRGLPRDPDEKATRGARLHERITTEGWTPGEGNVRLNVWDFGGQEIQHGTHRYFLTRRSLYLLVLEDRREDRGEARAARWLRVIESVAGQDAPVLVVVSKCDGAPQLAFDETGLRREFPQVKDVLRISCNDDDVSRSRIVALREAIGQLLTGEAMPHLRDKLPAEWLSVRDALGVMAREAPILRHQAFIKLCTDQELTEGHPIRDENQQRALLHLLRDLGTVITFGLDRDSAVALSTVQLFDPNWLTAAVYAILERIKIEERSGIFVRADLIEWLDPAVYPAERHEFIIAMMRDASLGLCFRLAGEEDRYLAPEGLPENSPDYSGVTRDALRFRYRYTELPRALIPRLIVRLHDFLEVPPKVWLTGARFRIGNAVVIVEGDRVKQVIEVSVLGNDRRAALFTFRQTMESLHQLYRELGAKAVVPMPDDPEIEESYDYLERLEREEGGGYHHRPSGAKRAYVVTELLDAVDNSRREPAGFEGKLGSTSDTPSELIPWWKSLLSRNVLIPAVVAFFGLVGGFRFGFDIYWSALLGFLCAAIGSIVLAMFDRHFLFRRLLSAWMFSGIAFFVAGAFEARFRAMGLELNYGGPPTWTVAAIWIFGAAVLVWLAHSEAQREGGG